jgi:plasmid stabilization system protein ParE
MKVIIREAAEDDLDRIFARIVQDNPTAAAATVAKIRDRIFLLETDSLTNMGRPGLDPDTRELIEYPHIIVYEIQRNRCEVEVLSIAHGARERTRE